MLVSGKNVYVLTSSAAAAFNINGDELWKQTLPKKLEIIFELFEFYFLRFSNSFLFFVI